jgi:3-oxoacyl-(acyl-carrier-protein) synthase
MGVLTPFGEGTDVFWHGLFSENSVRSTRELSGAWGAPFLCSGGFTDDRLAESVLGLKHLRSLSRESRLFVAAAVSALRIAGFQKLPEADPLLGVSVGTMFSGHQDFSEAAALTMQGHANFVNPALAPEAGYNAPASHTSIWTGAGGFNLTVSAGRASVMEAVRVACAELEAGRSSKALAGGVDVLSLPLAPIFDMTSCSEATRLSQGDIGARFSESALCFLLQPISEESKKESSIHIEAVDVGYSPAVGRDRLRATEEAMREFLDRAAVAPNQIDAVFYSSNCHSELDWLASRTILAVIGPGIPVCSSSFALGDCLGVSGGIQMAGAMISLQEQMLPPRHHFSDWEDRGLSTSIVSADCSATLLRRILVYTLDPDGFAGIALLRRGPLGGYDA